MKKMFVLFALMLLPLALMAQTEIPIPTDIGDVITRLTFWTVAFGPLIGLTIFLTATVNTIFKVTGAGLKQLISWGMGIVLVAVLNLINFGYPKDLIWYGVIAYGLATSLVANKGYDAGLIESILKLFKLTKPE
jgi:hypothetical protein